MTYAESNEIEDDGLPAVPLEPEEAEVLAVQVRTYITRLHKRYNELLTYGQLLRQQFPDEEGRSRDLALTLEFIAGMCDRLRRNASLTYREALALSLPVHPQADTTR